MPTTAKTPGRDLTEFRGSYDKDFIVPRKIEAALAKIGHERWDYNQDFQKLAGVTTNDLALFREQFTDFLVEVGGNGHKKIIWCGSKALATKLRAMV